MDSLAALQMGRANQGKECMVFDWDKAAALIKERSPSVAAAGLQSDWEWTGGEIYASGNPIRDNYTYLASTWARPELELDGERSECWKFASATPGWDASTKWPESALAILNG